MPILPPAAVQAQAYAYRFRLNENLAAALSRASSLLALLLMPLLAGAAALSAWAGTLRPLLAVLGAATGSALLALAAGLRQQPAPPVVAAPRPAGGGATAAAAAAQGKARAAGQPRAPPGKVRMVYAGPTPPGAAAGGEAEAAGEAAEPAAAVAQQDGQQEGGQQPQQEEGREAPKRRSAFQDVDTPAAGGGDAGAEGGSSGAGGAPGAPQALAAGRGSAVGQLPQRPLLQAPSWQRPRRSCRLARALRRPTAPLLRAGPALRPLAC